MVRAGGKGGVVEKGVAISLKITLLSNASFGDISLPSDRH